MNRRGALAGLTGAVAAGALAGCSDDDGPRPRLVVATGAAGGVYSPLGRALAGVMRHSWRSEALRTAGSVDNLLRVAQRRVELAFTTVDVAAQGQQRLGSFHRKVDLRAIAGLYSDHVHLVVRNSSTVSGLRGLGDQAVSTGAPGSGTEVVANRLMAAAGLSVRGYERHRLGLADSIAALRHGVIDAFFFSGGLPVPALRRLFLDASPPVRLLDLHLYVPILQGQFGEVYTTGWIPPSKYGTDSQYSVCIPNLLTVPASISDDTAYAVTRLLFRAKATLADAHPEGRQLDARSALATFPVTMHPGAERYYRGLKLV